MANLKTGFVWHELYMWHDTGTFAGVLPSGNSILEPEENTENAATKRRIKNLMDVAGITDQLERIKPREATPEELALVHTREYIAAIQDMSANGGGDARMDCPWGHTPFGPGGYEIAALAAGGVLEAVDAVIDRKVANAYALVRPIGHHAEPDKGLGFCMFNNGAIAARHAMQNKGIGKVAMVDWDVHHGNGAQKIFWEESDVLTISVHQDRVFPPDGRGGIDEIGSGDGEGYNLNIPLPPGTGVGGYLEAFKRLIVPALYKFKPDLIIVPSGFDGGAFDTLGRMMLHSGAFREMTAMMMQAADDLCGGRLLMCHEGGYHKASTPFFGLAVIEQLSGIKTTIKDPWMMIFPGMGGQELQPHQDALIASIEPHLDRL
ncbi:MAG: class II histone deacetylase [Pseudomonadota bacterium]